MAAVHAKSAVKEAEISFRPPHLEKVVFLMQVTGIANTSGPLRGFKKIALLIYNLITICVRLLLGIVQVILEVEKFSSTNLDSYLQGFIGFVMTGFQIYMMLYILFLSRKSLLASLPKSTYWISLPDEYENGSSVVSNTFFFGCNFLAFLLIIPGSYYFMFTRKDGIQRCEAISTNATNNTNDTYYLCYVAHILYLIGLPSFFCLMVVPTYVTLWII